MALALVVVAVAGSRAAGFWNGPNLVDALRPPPAAPAPPAPGHAGEPDKPLDLRWAVGPNAAPIDPAPGRWTRPVEQVAQSVGPRAP